MKRKLQAALVIMGAMTPFIAQADQPMNPPAAKPSYTAGEMVRDGQMPAGYNQSASYVVDNSWDMYFTGNFIYWHLDQDQASLGTLIKDPSTSAAVFASGSGEKMFVNPSYKPGFQVGMGFDMKGMDDWNLYAEYTWYKNSASNSIDVASDDIFAMDEDVVPVDGRVVLATAIDANATFHYNCADLAMQRNFYWGKKLTSKFGCGLRARWINEKTSMTATGLSYASSDALLSQYTSESGSVVGSVEQHSWALGPRFELASNWLLGMGFKIMGDVAGSVLYTRYTEISSSYVEGSALNYARSNNGKGTLRAITETSLGLGWGSYFGDNNDYHFDLSAAYEFNVHWNQNYNVHGSIPGNVYLHGLNVAARLDF